MKSKMAEQAGDAFRPGREHEFVPVTDFSCLFENGQFFEAAITPVACVDGLAPFEKCVKEIVMNGLLFLAFLAQCPGRGRAGVLLRMATTAISGRTWRRSWVSSIAGYRG